MSTTLTEAERKAFFASMPEPTGLPTKAEGDWIEFVEPIADWAAWDAALIAEHEAGLHDAAIKAASAEYESSQPR